MDVSASALRTFRFDQDCARSPRCFHRGSRGFEASNPGPIWLGPELLIEASLIGSACRFLFCTAGFWMRLAACDNVPRYLGYHVASVRTLFAYGIVVSRTPLECLKSREYFLQFFPALAKSIGIKFPPGCFVLQRQSYACRRWPARQDHLCLGPACRSDVLFGAIARQARRGGDGL